MDAKSNKSYHKTTYKTECFMLRPSEAPRRPRMASNASNMPPRRPKDGLLAPQDGPKKLPRRPQDASKMTPDAPRMVQTVPNFQTSIWDPPGLVFRPSRPQSGSFLGAMWARFGRARWCHFGRLGCPCFNNVGELLGTLLALC